ncbi:MAG: PorT family protein [Segetibacter sp.]|jgi:hypothetical protein|nr:PorT family protein [Segetibacter sp.]
MKKKILSATVISLMSLGVFAQTKGSANEGSFIIRGGLNQANISVTENGRVDEANTLTSFHVGIAFDLPLGAGLSFQPGATYTGKGAKTQVGQPTDNSYYKATSNPMYLEIPLNLVGKIALTENSKFYIGAGPYGAMGITGKNKVESKVFGLQTFTSRDIEFSKDDPTTAQEENNGYGKLKRFDYGLNALAGFEFTRFTIGANYGYGITKINSGADNGTNDRGKNRVLSFTLGLKL